MLLVLRGESRSTQPWSHLKLCAAGTNTTVLGSRRCELSVWMWDFRSSSHLIPRFGARPDRSPTRSPRHRITRLPIGASATDAVHQDDVDGQYPQSLMTSRWCPSSNMSHWPRLGRGQAPCSCSATATLKNDAIPVAIPDFLGIAIPILVERVTLSAAWCSLRQIFCVTGWVQATWGSSFPTLLTT